MCPLFFLLEALDDVCSVRTALIWEDGKMFLGDASKVPSIPKRVRKLNVTSGRTGKM